MTDEKEEEVKKGGDTPDVQDSCCSGGCGEGQCASGKCEEEEGEAGGCCGGSGCCGA